MTEVSGTRLYLGNLPRNVTKQDIEEHFANHGKITDIKVMAGFGFVEFQDPMDAKDVVPAFHGSEFKGERLTVQFARGPRHHKEFFPIPERMMPRPLPRRTIYRMQVSGLPETSWQDLKDFARQSGLDVVYSETSRAQDGTGYVEFESLADLKAAVEKLDGRDYKGSRIMCTLDIQPDDRPPRDSYYRARSPMRRGGYPPFDDYDRRGPPRMWSPRYRERSPPRRDYYPRDAYIRRTPPRDYPPPRRPYDDPYYPRGPAPIPPPRHYDDPYMRPYMRPRSPLPPRDYDGYDRRPYW